MNYTVRQQLTTQGKTVAPWGEKTRVQTLWVHAFKLIVRAHAWGPRPVADASLPACICPVYTEVTWGALTWYRLRVDIMCFYSFNSIFSNALRARQTWIIFKMPNPAAREEV